VEPLASAQVLRLAAGAGSRRAGSAAAYGCGSVPGSDRLPLSRARMQLCRVD